MEATTNQAGGFFSETASGDTPDWLSVMALPRPGMSRRRHLDVMVVEDSPADLRALEIGLGHMGHLVISATSVQAARELLRTFVVDVIVCDVRLPDGIAMDLLPEVRTRGHLPVVAMSADAYTLKAVTADGDFAIGFVKPLDLDELDRSLRSLCEHDAA